MGQILAVIRKMKSLTAMIVAIGIFFGILYGLAIPEPAERFATYQANSIIINPEMPLTGPDVLNSLGVSGAEPVEVPIDALEDEEEDF